MGGFARPRRSGRPERLRSGLPLSPNEDRYVLSEAMATETFGNPWVVRITGALDERRLWDAVQATCDRHEGRRTGYEASGDGRFTRYVEARGRPDVRSVPMVGASPAAVRQVIRAWFFERCDLSPPSLTRFLLIRTARDEHLLGVYLHHAVNDGETHQATVSEIVDRYAGRPPEGLAAQYSDLWTADWRATPAYREAEAFWRDFLSGIETVGGLPADGGDPPGADWTGPARVTVPAAVSRSAIAAAKAAGVSEFAFYYAVTLVLLSRLTGERRVCSTFQSGGRKLMPGSEGVHGVFSNGLVLAAEVDEAESIAALAGRLRGDIRAALAHEALPYHHIIQTTGLRPRFGINWYPDVAFPPCPGLVFHRPEMDFGTWEYDLNIRYFRDPASGGVDVILYFREPSISRPRAVAAGEQFVALLAALSADAAAPAAATPLRALAPPGLLPDPAAPLPAGGGELIHAGFLRQARKRPDAVAFSHRGRTQTYGEVERRSRALAARLRADGVQPGDRVAILADRSPELVIAMLAASRLGAVFAVLDAAYPPARLEALAAIAAPKVIVAAGGVQEGARALAAACGALWLGADIDVADPAVPGLDEGDIDDPAYILFTSGSTGAPKGVAASHAPLSRFVAWQAQAYGLSADDRFACLSGLSHDPLLRDVFTPLTLGATLVIPQAETIQAPGALAAWFRAQKISVAHITPPLGQVLTAGAARVRRLPALRRLFWGGDLLPPELVAQVQALAPGVRQANFYGATETPQAVGVLDDCLRPWPRRAVPVGRGANGTQLLVVDAAGQALGIGEPGEIAVRSNFLSLGYVEAGRVIPPADRGLAGDTYRTGDRGLHLPGGEVLMLGRADDQIKVRGYRVELAEVAAALCAHPKVVEAVALAVGEDAGQRIIAFVAGRGLTEAELRAGVAARLPSYMQPAAIRVLERLPLLPNGKVDRQALIAREALAAPVAGIPGATPSERALIEAWTAVLGGAAISRDSTFAALGGDSLSYVQAYLATEEVIGVVPTDWQTLSIVELAASARATNGAWSVVDTPMLVRAVAIVAIVALHMGLAPYGGGATSGLMMVSGFLLGGLQLKQTFARGSARPILEALERLFLPTLLFSVALFTAKQLAGRDPDLSVLFLYGNFQDYSKLSSPHWGGHEFYLWFIHCMLQMLALLWLAGVALKAAGAFRIGLAGFVLILFAAGCVGRFVAPALLIPGFVTGGASQLTTVNFLPTTHLATLMLGALIATAATTRQRIGIVALLAAYAALTAHFYSPRSALVIFAAGLLILAVRRVVLPRVMTRLVLMLSGASLFIYLTQFVFRSALRAAGAPEWPALHLVAALAGGVMAWGVWTWGMAAVARWRRRQTTADVAI